MVPRDNTCPELTKLRAAASLRHAAAAGEAIDIIVAANTGRAARNIQFGFLKFVMEALYKLFAEFQMNAAYSLG